MLINCPLSIAPREIIDRSIIHEDYAFDEISNELMVHDPLSNTNHSKLSILGTKFISFAWMWNLNAKCIQNFPPIECSCTYSQGCVLLSCVSNVAEQKHISSTIQIFSYFDSCTYPKL